MPIVTVNPGEFHSQYGWWAPTAKIHRVLHGGARRNPVERIATARKPLLSARLFVGMNVGGRARWKIKDVIASVTAALKRLAVPVDSSYLSQTGVWSSMATGRVVQEKSAQVVLFNLHGATEAAFGDQVAAVADAVRIALRQESVVAEVQRNGVSRVTIFAHA